MWLKHFTWLHPSNLIARTTLDPLSVVAAINLLECKSLSDKTCSNSSAIISSVHLIKVLRLNQMRFQLKWLSKAMNGDSYGPNVCGYWKILCFWQLLQYFISKTLIHCWNVWWSNGFVVKWCIPWFKYIYHMPKPLIVDCIKWLYVLTQKIANCLCQLLVSIWITRKRCHFVNTGCNCWLCVRLECATQLPLLTLCLFIFNQVVFLRW